MRNLLLIMIAIAFGLPSYAQLNCNNVNAAITVSASGATATLVNSSTPTFTSNIYTFYTINWGDNTTTNAYNNNNQQHTYTASGTYTIALYSHVLDSANNISCYDTATGSVTVTVPPLNCNNVNAVISTSMMGGGSGVILYNSSTPNGGLNLSVQYNINWGDGNSLNTSSKSIQTHTYTSNGSYTIRLIVNAYDSANNIGCTDTAYSTINVTNTGFNCNNVNASFYTTLTNKTVTAINLSTPNPGSGVGATYKFYWGDGNNTTKTTKSNTSYTYAANGSYTIMLIATYTNGTITCVDSTIDTVFVNHNPTPQNVISGAIWVDSTSTLDSYKVWLIEFDSATNILSAVDSTIVGAFAGYGNYHFNNVAAGAYRTKAARLNGPTSGIGHVPTYHDSALLWSNANVISHTGGTTTGKNIYMKTGTLTSGPGFIGGNVLQGANKGTANGIKGMNILLLDASDNVISYAITDANGEYSFPSLPTGKYKVHPEDMNYTTTPVVVDITNNKLSHNAVYFERSKSQMTIVPVAVGVTDVNNKALAFSVYPNPAKNVVTINWANYSDDMATVVITDISGKKVISTQVEMSNNASVNVSELQTGFYFMNVATEFGNHTQKLIVE